MSDQSKTIATAAIRRIQLTRRPPRREALPDTTLTESWPPRLNTQL